MKRKGIYIFLLLLMLLIFYSSLIPFAKTTVVSVFLRPPPVLKNNLKNNLTDVAPVQPSIVVNMDIFNQSVGSELILNVSDNVSYTFLITEVRQDQESTTLVGLIKENVEELKSVIVNHLGNVYGEVIVKNSSDENLLRYQIDSETNDVLTQQEQLPIPLDEDDQIFPPDIPLTMPMMSRQVSDLKTLLLYQDPNPQSIATLDIWIVVSQGLANFKGSGLQTYLIYLIQVANTAFSDSGVFIRLNLLESQIVNESDSVNLSSVLPLLSANADPFQGLETLRNTTGADLVVFLRKYTTGGTACGVAYTLGYQGSLIGQERYAYSVVELGSAGGYSCADSSFPHEIGHNLGAVHDLLNAGGKQGIFPYSYGYGVSGQFGDIMSYINPRVLKFSNPLILCKGTTYYCGVADHADVVRSFNVVRFQAEAWKSKPTLTLSVTKTGTGTITSSDGKINCGNICSSSYSINPASSVVLVETPLSNWKFQGWANECSGTSSSCYITLDTDHTINALFQPILYGVYVSKPPKGTIQSIDGLINCGLTSSICSALYIRNSQVTLQAYNSDPLYKFMMWQNDCYGTAPVCKITINTNKVVDTHFILR